MEDYIGRWLRVTRAIENENAAYYGRVIIPCDELPVWRCYISPFRVGGGITARDCPPWREARSILHKITDIVSSWKCISFWLMKCLFFKNNLELLLENFKVELQTTEVFVLVLQALWRRRRKRSVCRENATESDVLSDPVTYSRETRTHT